VLSSHSSFNDVRPHLDRYQAVIYGQEEICGINDVLSGRSHIPCEAPAHQSVGEYSEGGQLLNGGLTCSLGEAFGVKSSRMVSNSYKEGIWEEGLTGCYCLPWLLKGDVNYFVGSLLEIWKLVTCMKVCRADNYLQYST